MRSPQSNSQRQAQPSRERFWKRRRVRVVAAVLIVVAVLVAVFDHWLPYMLLSHYKFAVEPNPAIFAEYGATAERVSFQTSDGLAIAGWFVPASGSSGCTVIVLHTLGRTRADMLGFTMPLWRRGLNLLLIDMLGHGESGGNYFTYGYHEWRDVAGAIDYLAARVAVLGASAGGAVAIAAAARDSRIEALVSIASFADLERIVYHRASWLPRFWLRRAMRKAERLAQFSVAESSPVRDIARVTCPILLVHGDADNTVPFGHASELYMAARAPKDFRILHGGTHANMFSLGGDLLREKVATFLSGGSRR
ncbi:MAG: alpha/beta hydrolase [Planctomycetes bacterium]|nr:alpha/beta hydrolase [Planctomycetota bacterium]